MKYPCFPAALFALLISNNRLPAAVHYVNANNPNPSAPFTTWATSATNIQDAVDVASSGDQVVVTNGLYATGGRAVDDAMTNRVAVTFPITISSVNGPDVTIIRGSQVPGTLFGDGAVRCVYLADGAKLVGFTLTNGASLLISEDLPYRKSGGGVIGTSTSAVVSNCIITGCAAYNYGGGAFGVTLSNCTLIGNLGFHGGGASDCTLVNCTLAGNSTTYVGGGAFNSILLNCAFVTNSTSVSGGGADSSTLDNCFLFGNTSQTGGGVNASTLNHCELDSNAGGFGGGGGGGATSSTLTYCILTNNYGGGRGGGAWFCNLSNCVLVGNGVSTSGGGALESTLHNCAIVANSSSESGGGVAASTLFNCISYFNNNDNFTFSTLSYSCTTPDPGGVGNITNPPLFADEASGNFRLLSTSPCINSGLNDSTPTGPDLDGNIRIVAGTVDMGPYEFQNPSSIISYAWLQQFGLPIDGSADLADSDGDHMINFQEWIAGTIPTNSSSVLRMLSPAPSAPGATVRWQSVTNRLYFLQRATNPIFPFETVVTNIPGDPLTTSFSDTNATGNTPYFFRVGTHR